MAVTWPHPTYTDGVLIQAAHLNIIRDNMNYLYGANARVYNSTDISLTTSTTTLFTFNSERQDTGSFHSTSSNTGRLTVTTAGMYLIGFTGVFASNATGFREIWFQVNGATRIADLGMPAISGLSNRMSLVTLYQMAAADYVEVYGYQTSGGNLAMSALGNYSPEFWIVGPL